MNEKDVSAGMLYRSEEWTVSLTGDSNRLEIVNLQTKNFSVAWLGELGLKMSGLVDLHLAPVSDEAELRRHYNLAMLYSKHLK